MYFSNVTVEFPWLDQNYKMVHEPWPFKTWPRTGRALIGSNFLRIRIEDIPAEYEYTAKKDQMWTVKGAYRYARTAGLLSSKLECDADPTCYGFQFLTSSQLNGIVEQQQIPSIGIGATAGQPWLVGNPLPGDLTKPDLPFLPAYGFSDRPPTIWGLADTTWDGLLMSQKEVNWDTISKESLPNTFYFRESFDRFDIQGYRYNAMTYTRKPRTRKCLGPYPNTERLLDIRIITTPLNQPPILTAQKPFWRIQKGYSFPVPGIRLYDGDATWLSGQMEVSFLATRGAFTNPDTTGLQYVRGKGTEDIEVQIFRCSYRQCQQAIQNIRFSSVDTTGTDVITLIVNDRGNSGELGALSASISITLSLATGPYNTPPIVHIPGLPARVAHPGQRVDISGIYVEDADSDRPRWDKPYSQGLITVFMILGRGYFDVTRLRRRGLQTREDATGAELAPELPLSIKLGTADGSADEDCPCLTPNNTCPCNHWALTTYCKISGHKPDIKWAVAEVSVYLDLDDPDKTNSIDTTLVIVVDDNCNTGFSDDSGVQRPCLRDTHSLVILENIAMTTITTPLMVSPSSRCATAVPTRYRLCCHPHRAAAC